jgi:hypothetical protein
MTYNIAYNDLKDVFHVYVNNPYKFKNSDNCLLIQLIKVHIYKLRYLISTSCSQGFSTRVQIL